MYIMSWDTTFAISKQSITRTLEGKADTFKALVEMSFPLMHDDREVIDKLLRLATDAV